MLTHATKLWLCKRVRVPETLTRGYKRSHRSPTQASLLKQCSYIEQYRLQKVPTTTTSYIIITNTHTRTYDNMADLNNNNNDARRGDDTSLHGDHKLDTLIEKVTNAEHNTNETRVIETLLWKLEREANSEKLTRDCAVTFKISDKHGPTEIKELILKHWVEPQNSEYRKDFRDKEHYYVEFFNLEQREKFIHAITEEIIYCPLKELLVAPNYKGQYITRHPVKIEIPNLKASYKLKVIMAQIQRFAGPNCIIQNIREGKTHATTKCRAIMMQVNADGFRHLFDSLQGRINYLDRDLPKIKGALKIHINARPWICRDCYTIGRHTCKGKACSNCCLHNHTARECKAKTTYCNNCKRKGHKSKDPSCPKLVNSIITELRKMDIPLKYLKEPHLVKILISHLMFK